MLQHGSDIHPELPDVVRDGDKHVRHAGRAEREGRAEVELVLQDGGAEAQSAQELALKQLRRLHSAQHEGQDADQQRRQEHHRAYGAEHLVRQEASAHLEEEPMRRGDRVDVQAGQVTDD